MDILFINIFIMNNDVYYLGVKLFGILGFICIWIYSFATWGFLIGLAIGWLPALIGGVIIGLLWPIFLILLVLFVLLIFYST